MDTTNLSAYIAKRRNDGARTAEIKKDLIAVGWAEDAVNAAYAKALRDSGVPVPEGAKGAGAKRSSTLEIVLNFFSFILLGIVITALGSLYFEVIDKYLPDAAAGGGYGSRVSSDAVHYAIAALAVAFPLYFFSVRLWFRAFREEEGKAESRLTKWITYLVLLASSVTIVGDLISVLFSLLQGEITARFFAKAFVVLAISGAVFGFYFLERRKVQYGRDISRKVFQRFGWGLLAVIVAGVILGFFAVGSPQVERQRTFDTRRAGDLTALSDCTHQYAQEYKRLPSALSDLEQSEYSYCASLKDPETGAPYEYAVTAESQVVGTTRVGEYQLCATFSLASDEGVVSREQSALYPYEHHEEKWHKHAAGRECDVQTVVLEDRNAP